MRVGVRKFPAKTDFSFFPDSHWVEDFFETRNDHVSGAVIH
jgi:hypothetical protein